MAKSIQRLDLNSEIDIIREAQKLRAETVGAFFGRLFGSNEKNKPVFPAHIAPAE